jgi:hypothetical protein
MKPGAARANTITKALTNVTAQESILAIEMILRMFPKQSHQRQHRSTILNHR